MGKKSRTKGAKAENDVCAILREHGPWPNAERDLDQVRGHDNGVDIYEEPFAIQVKRRKRITAGVVETGLTEATQSAPVGFYAACIHRSDRAEWRVTMTVGDLTDLGGGRTTFGEMADALVEMDLVEWCRLCGEVMR